MKIDIKNPEAQNLINELDKNRAVFFEACSAINTIADINALFTKQKKAAPYSATPLSILRHEATSEGKRLQAKLESIQALCPHNYENVKQYKHSEFYTWTGNGHNCDYYTCKECGHEVKN